MKRKLLLGGGIILLMMLVVLGIRFFSGEDDWICNNGAWVKHGNPSSEMPTTPCKDQENENIIITQPKKGDLIASPLEIKGEAKGTWYFEASFPIKLLDENGNELASGIAQAQGNWMTEDFVPFSASFEFAPSYTGGATLVFMKDNPSGLPENDAQFSMSVKVEQSKTIIVKAFFNNSNFDPEASCNKVFSVERVIPRTQAVATAALEELLKGPTDKEKAQGFFTSINEGVKIQQLVIEDNIARADFDEQLEYQVGGSCRVSAIRNQIIETLKQFSTVKDVTISIDGRIEDILQP